MSAVPNVTNVPTGGNLVGTKRHVGFRGFDDGETFRKVTWKGHSTPFRSHMNGEEFTPISHRSSQRFLPQSSPLQWDYHDFGLPGQKESAFLPSVPVPSKHFSERVPGQSEMHQAYQPSNLIEGNPPINHSYPHFFQQYQPNSTRSYNQLTAPFLYDTQPRFFWQNQHLQPSSFTECGNQMNNHHVSILNYPTSC